MKFSCTQENLNVGLQIVSHIAGKHANLPILGNVLLKCDANGMRLSSTNLEIAVSCNVRGKVEETGEFTVPSKLFSEYVALLPKERVDMSLSGIALELACGSYKTKMNGIAAAEFPIIPTVEEKVRFSLPAAELRRAISHVQFAVAINESRPEISGVLCKFVPAQGGVELILAATDSYRLAEKVVHIPGASLNEPVQVIVPARTVAEVVRVFGVFKESTEVPEKMDIRIGDSQIMFSYNGVEVISRVIEGKYPDYRQLVPSQFGTEAFINRNELSRAVKTTSLFSRSGLNDVHLGFAPDSAVKIKSTGTQTGEHEVVMEGEVRGRENALTVNYKYFLDGVNTLETDDVAVQLNDAVSPCIVRPAQKGKVESGYLYIVMPIRQ